MRTGPSHRFWSYPGVVVIHHMPGLGRGNQGDCRKFAHHGYVAISPNLHYREGKATAEENSASVRAAGGMPDDRSMGDAQEPLAISVPCRISNGKVGIIGYCSGGRQAYLAACTLSGIDAAIDCYGGGLVAPPAELNPRQPVAPIEYSKDLRCPLLGLLGGRTGVRRQRSGKNRGGTQTMGKTYAFHMYDNAGHAFFSVDRPSYRQEAAVEGWKQVFRWYEKYLR